jgi:hypothetical protein
MTVYRTQFTYASASTAFTPGATPQDVFIIEGTTVDNIAVIKMGISTTQTTDGVNQWNIIKRSTLNTGGTSALVPIVSYDAQNPGSLTLVQQYTVNPTAGVTAHIAWSGWVPSPTITTVGAGNNIVEVDFVDQFGQPMMLTGSTELLAWNFGGAALPAGLSVLAYVVWYESPKS